MCLRRNVSSEVMRVATFANSSDINLTHSLVARSRICLIRPSSSISSSSLFTSISPVSSSPELNEKYRNSEFFRWQEIHSSTCHEPVRNPLHYLPHGTFTYYQTPLSHAEIDVPVQQLLSTYLRLASSLNPIATRLIRFACVFTHLLNERITVMPHIPYHIKLTYVNICASQMRKSKPPRLDLCLTHGQFHRRNVLDSAPP